MYNALIVEKNDDVAVVLEAIHVGDKVTYRYGDEERSVVSLSEVPVYHKVAVRDIKRGDHILKYGEKLGVATQDIKLGERVHVQNLDSEREDL